MAPKTHPLLFSLGSILLLVLSSFVLPAQTVAAASFPGAANELPDLAQFVRELENGDSGQLRGVYAPGLFANMVVQQPQGDPTFVSPRTSILTQFSSASRVGSVGLLAHNYRAGAQFKQIRAGQVIYLVFGDGSLRRYSVQHLFRYQALQPNSAQSNFIDLENGSRLTTQALFTRMYGRKGALVLQTCIESDGIDTWGRLFVIAEPAPETRHLAFSGR
jgi:hypothetical protein